MRLKTTITAILIVLTYLASAQPYDDSQYYLDVAAGLEYNGHQVLPLNTWLIDVAQAIQNGETDIYVYLVNDGSNIAITIGSVSYSKDNTGMTCGESQDFWNGKEMIFASTFQNYVFGHETLSNDFFANSNVSHFATPSMSLYNSGCASSWDLITFTPRDIDFQQGGVSQAYGEYTVRYIYGLCNQNYSRTQQPNNDWVFICPGTETQGTLDIHLVWINPSQNEVDPFGSVCINDPDLSLISDTRLFELMDPNPLPTGNYNTSANLLDISSCDPGNLTIEQDWSIASRYVPYRTSAYNLTTSSLAGEILDLPTVTTETEFITCENTGLTPLPNGTPAGGTWSGAHVTGGNAWDTDGHGTGTWTATYTYTDGLGCTNTADMTVVVDPSPTLSTSGNVTICPNEETTLTVSGAASYAWSPADGLSATAGNTVRASPTTTTTYNIISTSESGCQSQAAIIVTVRSPYNTQATTTMEDLCQGSQTQLGVANAIAGLSYEWSPSSRVTNALIEQPHTNINTTTTFNLEVTTPEGCIEQSQVTVFVDTPPNADAGDDVEVCTGSSYQLNGTASSGTGTLSYTWAGVGITADANTATPTVSTTVDRTYTLTVTDENGCTNADQVMVEVNTATANAGTDRTICSGESTPLGTSGGIQYAWSPVTGLSDASVNAPLATPAATTEYTVTVTDNDGCTDTDMVTVYVEPIPSLTVSADQHLCKGESTQLTASGANTYSWSPSSGLSNAAIANPLAAPGNTTVYTVTGTGVNGCATTDQVIVHVNEPPEVDAGSDVEVCLSATTTLNGSATGQGPFTYSWTPTAGLSDASIPNPEVTGSANTSYTLTVTDNNGCIATDRLDLQVNTATANAGTNTTICVGESLQLAASGGIAYTWAPAAGLNDTNTSSPLATPNETTTYTVTVTNSYGCTTTDDVTITVSELPTLTASADQAICKGGSTTLSAAGANSYSWSPSSGLSASNIANPVASPSSTTVYAVTGTGTNGCEVTEQVVITVHELPEADAGNDVDICAGEDFLLRGSATGIGPFTYAWTPTAGITAGSNTANPTLNTTINRSYLLTVTDTNGCVDTDQVSVEVSTAIATVTPNQTICGGESVQLVAAGGIQFSWAPAAGLNSTSTSSPLATPPATTTYTVTVTDNLGCQDTNEVTITVDNRPLVSASSDQTICRGDNTTLSANGAATYKWSPAAGLNNAGVSSPVASPAATTVYTVTGTASNGCTDTDQVIVYVNELPAVDAGSDVEACAGVNTILTATASGTPPLTYAWSPAEDIIAGANTLNPTINITSDKAFTLAVTDGNGCISSDQVVVEVNAANANAGPDQQICQGDQIQLTASGGSTYSWNPSTGLSDANTSSPIASPASTTTYTVTVTNNDGCSDADEVTLTVEGVPSLTASADQTICKGQNVNLTASGAVSYTWSPKIGLNNANVATPIASPSVTTLYTVTGTNANGCTQTEEVIIFVNDLPSVNAGDDRNVCGGIDHVLNGSAAGNGPFSFNWTPTTGILSGGSTATPTINITSDIIYLLTVTDVNGCTSSDEVEVNARGAAANAGPDVTICTGEATQLSGSGGNTYAWSPATGLSADNIPNPTATPNTTTTYTLTVADNDGCLATDQVTVTVDDIPSLVTSGDETICKGDAVTLSASGATSYEWSPSTGLNNRNIPTPSASPSITTIYTVAATNAAGCTVENEIIVYVNEGPEADAGADREVCQHTDFMLTGTASGTAPFSYSWSPTTGIIAGEQTATPTLNLASGRTYLLTVEDSNGCMSSDQIEVEVNFASASAGNDETICAGESIALSATGGISYAWSPATGLNNTSASAPIATPATTTTYTVTTTDGNGCQDIDEVTVYVDPTPVVTAIDDQTLCKGSSTTLSASGATTYIWSPSVGLNNPNVAAPVASPTITTVYTVTGSNPTGCTSTDEVIVYVNELPAVDAGSDVDLCAGSTYTLSATVTGNGPFTYAWSPQTGITSGANTATPDINLTNTTTYTLTVTDANGCTATDEKEAAVSSLPAPFISVDDLVTANVDICIGQTIQLEANGGVEYEWSPAAGLSATNINDPVTTVIGDMTYTVVVTNAAGCVDSTHLVINAIDNPTVDAGAPLQLCIDANPYDLRGDVNIQGGTFSGTGVDVNGFLFDPTDAGVGTHILTYDVVLAGCSGSSTREVQVLDVPNIDGGEDREICLGDSTALFGTGGVYFEWSPPTGLNKSIGAVVRAAPTIPTTYTVRGIDANGCENVDHVFVDVISFNANAGSNTTICEGEATQLNASSPGAISYQWSPPTGLNDDGIEDPQVTPLVTTTYTLTTTNAQGCTATDEVRVTVDEQPSLTAGAPLQLCQNDDPYDLRADVNIGGGEYNSSSSALSGVLFDPAADNPGIYFVDYAITQGHCTVTTQREIEIYTPPNASLNRTDLNLCVGETFQLLATGGTSYQWTPDDHLSDASIANPVLTANEALTYTVEVTDARGCATTLHVDVDVEYPKVDAGIDVTICQGASVELDARGADSYTWSPTTHLENVNAPNPVASPTSTTEYTVTGTTTDGCVVEDRVIVTVKDLPELYAGAKLTLCQGEPVYDLRQDVNIGGGTFSGDVEGLSGVLFDPTMVGIGIYFVEYTVDVDGCTLHATREIEIKPIPTITSAEEYEVCRGEGVQLLASGGTIYSWSPTTNIDDPARYNPIVTPDANTIYSVTVGDASGCTSTQDILVTVNQPQVNAGSDVTICQGESIGLTGTGGATYRWTPTTGLSDPNVRTPQASPSITTTYTVTATDNKGCTGTDNVTVTVEAAPLLEAGDKLMLCYDESPYDLRQGVNIHGGTFTSTSPALDGVLFDPKREDPGIFFVTYTVNVNNCVTSRTREIEIRPAPAGSVLKDSYAVCPGGKAQLSASGGVSYRWEPALYLDDATAYNPVATPASDVTYIVSITDLFGCTTQKTVNVAVDGLTSDAGIDQTICEGESVRLQGSGGSTFSWTPATGLSDARTEDPVATPSSTTTYTLTVRNAEGCESNDQVTINVNPSPSLEAGGKVILCVDDTPYDLRTDVTVAGGTFSSTSAGLDGVLFNPALVGRGIYFVNYTVELDGCSVTRQREIEVKGLPVIQFDQGSYEICQGQSIQVAASGGSSYEWYPKTDISDPYSANPTFTPSTSRTYELEVTSTHGCKARKQVDISVQTMEATLTEDVSICQGESVALTATGGVTYVWEYEPSLSAMNSSTPTATPVNTTTYHVAIINGHGCVIRDSVKVTVTSPPTLEVGPTLDLCQQDAPYDLRVDVNIPGGDFTSASNALNEVLFDPAQVSAGIHFVTYTVTSNSCTTSERREIHVHTPPQVTVSDDELVACRGASVQLAASGGTNYTWEPTTGLNDPHIYNPIATVTADMTYTVHVTDSKGCSATHQVQVSIDDMTSNAGIDQTICAGESVQLQGRGGSTYAWSPATGLSNAGIADPVASPTSTTTYTLTVRNAEGCEHTDEVTVNVNPSPELIVGEVLILCQDGDPVDLREDVNIAGGSFTSPSSGLQGVLFDPSREAEGIYFVNYSVNVNGCTLNNTREIQIKGQPDIRFDQGSYEICAGDDIQISVTGGIAYEWYPKAFITDAYINDPFVAPPTTTTYEVAVTDEYGCTATAEVTIVVNDIIANAGNDVNLCQGEAVTLKATGGEVYQWAGGEINGFAADQPTVAPAFTTTYTVSVLSSDGCTDTDEVTVHVTAPIELTAGEELVLCRSDAAPYDLRQDVSHSGGTFSSASNGLSTVFFDAQAVPVGVYFVNYEVTIEGCTYTATREIEVKGAPSAFPEFGSYELCLGESARIAILGDGAQYLWSGSPYLNTLQSHEVVATPDQSTVFTVKVFDQEGCSRELEVPVIVHNAMADAGNDITICYGDEVQLNASGGVSYEWIGGQVSDAHIANPHVSPQESTDYTVKVTTANGCVDTDQVTVLVRPPINLSAGEPLTLCSSEPSPYDLRKDVSHGGGVFTSASDGLSGVFFDASLVNPGVYFVSYALEVNECPYETTREIEVQAAPPAFFEFDQYEVCRGDSVQLKLIGTGNLSYEWRESSTIGDRSSASTYAAPVINTTYYVDIFNSLGCRNTESVTVTVNDIDGDAGRNLTLCEGETTSLNATGGDLYTWDPDPTMYGRHEADPEVSPTATTKYFVTITNDSGCQLRDSVTVTVMPAEGITFTDSSRVALCLNDDVVDLNEYVDQAGITWDSPESTSAGLLDPQKTGPGTFVINMALTNTSGCTSTKVMTVKVNRLPTVDAGPDIEVCLDADTLDIARLALPAGGDFFGPGIVEGSLFVPTAAGEGRHELVYTYHDPETGCSGVASRLIEVLEPSPVFAGPPLSVCIDSEPIDLKESVNPTGGSFFATTGVNGTWFYPSTGVGDYQIVYTVTDENQCQSQDIRTITVNERPELTITPAAITRCRNEGLIDLNTFVNIAGGRWSGTHGIVNGLVPADSLAAGTTILSYSVSTADGCALAGQLIIDIEEIELLDIDANLTTCRGGDPIDLLDGLNREFVNVSGEGVNSAGIFEPWTVARGTHKLTYLYTNTNGCIATQTKSIVVQGEVFVDAGEDLTVCQNIGTIDLTDIGTPDGGIWSGDFVGLNRFEAQAAAIGRHELYYSIDLGLGCSNTDTLIIEVESSDISDFGSDTILCVNSSELVLNFSSELRDGSWSGAGVVNNIFYPEQAGPGTWNLNYENGNFDCEIAGQRQVVVIALPDKAITEHYNISGCIGDIIRLSADVIAPDQQSRVEYEWYLENAEKPFAIGKTIDYQITGNENIYFNTVNQFGCKPNEVDFIRITANGPVGDFEISADTVEMGQLVQFIPFSSNVDDFLWSFGDGNSNTDEIAYYYYYSTGWHDVSLTLTSEDGCSYTIVKEDILFVKGPGEDQETALSTRKPRFSAKIYPNPAVDEVLVAPNRDLGGKLSILGLDGKLLFQQPMGGEQRIDISGLPQGISWLVLNADNGRTYSKKLIITR